MTIPSAPSDARSDDEKKTAAGNSTASGSTSFVDLVERLHSGDVSAPADIFRRYSERLVRLAAQRIVGAMRQKVDAEDVVQSAFLSFFRKQSPGAFDLRNWDDLWSLLVTFTVRKCNRQLRRYLSKKRTVNQEKPQAADNAEMSNIWEPMAREPTPAEVAALNDTVERLLNSLDDRGRSVAELTLQGHSTPEIAAALGIAERTVFRDLARIRAIFDP